MIGGMCGVVRDIIPYGIAHGNRSILQGLNLIGLRRKKIPNKEIMILLLLKGLEMLFLKYQALLKKKDQIIPKNFLSLILNAPLVTL